MESDIQATRKEYDPKGLQCEQRLYDEWHLSLMRGGSYNALPS